MFVSPKWSFTHAHVCCDIFVVRLRDMNVASGSLSRSSRSLSPLLGPAWMYSKLRKIWRRRVPTLYLSS